MNPTSRRRRGGPTPSSVSDARRRRPRPPRARRGARSAGVLTVGQSGDFRQVTSMRGAPATTCHADRWAVRDRDQHEGARARGTQVPLLRRERRPAVPAPPSGDEVFRRGHARADPNQLSALRTTLTQPAPDWAAEARPTPQAAAGRLTPTRTGGGLDRGRSLRPELGIECRAGWPTRRWVGQPVGFVAGMGENRDTGPDRTRIAGQPRASEGRVGQPLGGQSDARNQLGVNGGPLGCDESAGHRRFSVSPRPADAGRGRPGLRPCSHLGPPSPERARLLTVGPPGRRPR